MSDVNEHSVCNPLLSDREIIDACASVVYGDDWERTKNGVICTKNRKLFWPLTDANDERMVFEHAKSKVRETARKRLAYKYGAWHQYLNLSRVGDISRVIAEVVVEGR